MKKKVAVIMGSRSDEEVMKGCFSTLEEFGIPYDIKILSAHRTPDEVAEFAKKAHENYDVIIAAAGYAAHLAGVVASHTTLPVIGIPIDSSPLKGFDSLLSTVQMPSGVPVATVSVGKAGAKNAAILAAQIIATCDDELRDKLKLYKQKLKQKVLKG